MKLVVNFSKKSVTWKAKNQLVRRCVHVLVFLWLRIGDVDRSIVDLSNESTNSFPKPDDYHVKWNLIIRTQLSVIWTRHKNYTSPADFYASYLCYD